MRSHAYVALLMFIAAGCAAPTGTGEDGEGEPVLYGQCGNSPNYTGSVTSDGVMIRWWSFPVDVHVDYSGAPGADDGAVLASYRAAVEAGLRIWEDAGAGIGEVRFVSSASRADITVSFGFLAGDVTGSTDTFYDADGFITRASTVLDTEYAEDVMGTPDFHDAMLGLAGHEMGHALFADNHSPFFGDIMRLGADQTFLSARDINTIREFYCTTP